jgi:hypothetical protein
LIALRPSITFQTGLAFFASPTRSALVTLFTGITFLTLQSNDAFTGITFRPRRSRHTGRSLITIASPNPGFTTFTRITLVTFDGDRCAWITFGSCRTQWACRSRLARIALRANDTFTGLTFRTRRTFDRFTGRSSTAVGSSSPDFSLGAPLASWPRQTLPADRTGNASPVLAVAPRLPPYAVAYKRKPLCQRTTHLLEPLREQRIMSHALLRHLGAKFRNGARRLSLYQLAFTRPLLLLLRDDFAQRFTQRLNEW